MKNRKRNTSYAKKFQKWQKNLGPAQSSFLILVIIVAALFAAKQVQTYRERALYQRVERHITAYADEAARLAPSNKKSANFCSYSSAKYERGSLSCTVQVDVMFNKVTEAEVNQILLSAKQLETKLPWKFEYDNTSQNDDRPYIKTVRVYSYKYLTCGPSAYITSDEEGKAVYNEGKTQLTLTIDCTGPALKEYY
jgi:hypothetical protein